MRPVRDTGRSDRPAGRRPALCVCGHPPALHDLIDHDEGQAPGDIRIRQELGLARYSILCDGMEGPSDNTGWPRMCSCDDFVPGAPLLTVVPDA